MERAVSELVGFYHKIVSCWQVLLLFRYQRKFTPHYIRQNTLDIIVISSVFKSKGNWKEQMLIFVGK